MFTFEVYNKIEFGEFYFFMVFLEIKSQISDCIVFTIGKIRVKIFRII